MTALDDVRAFHRHVGQPVALAPSPLTPDRRRLRLALILEEVGELAEAMGSDGPLVDLLKAAVRIAQADQFRNPMDLVGTADGCRDIVYVVLGTEAEAGLPGDDVFAEIHRSNMTKSKDNVRGDGKILKGPEYSPPNIAAVLQRATARAIGMQAGAEATIALFRSCGDGPRYVVRHRSQLTAGQRCVPYYDADYAAPVCESLNGGDGDARLWRQWEPWDPTTPGYTCAIVDTHDPLPAPSVTVTRDPDATAPAVRRAPELTIGDRVEVDYAGGTRVRTVVMLDAIGVDDGSGVLVAVEPAKVRRVA